MTLVNEPVNRDQQKKKYCRFKKSGIKYVDYKLKVSEESSSGS